MQPVPFTVREMTAADREAWSAMRAALWPGSPDEHAADIDKLLSDSRAFGLIAETERVVVYFRKPLDG